MPGVRWARVERVLCRPAHHGAVAAQTGRSAVPDDRQGRRDVADRAEARAGGLVPLPPMSLRRPRSRRTRLRSISFAEVDDRLDRIHNAARDDVVTGVAGAELDQARRVAGIAHAAQRETRSVHREPANTSRNPRRLATTGTAGADHAGTFDRAARRRISAGRAVAAGRTVTSTSRVAAHVVHTATARDAGGVGAPLA